MSKYVSSPIALQLYFNSGENGVIAPTVVDGITRRKVDLPQFKKTHKTTFCKLLHIVFFLSFQFFFVLWTLAARPLMLPIPQQ